MGRDRHQRDRQRDRLTPFVPLLIDTLDSLAWKALSHGARSLYIALKRKYSIRDRNNGRLFLSQRDAAEELGSDRHQISRWYRELQHYGFLAMVTPGSLGVDGKGKAPHWRLTELGYMRDPPTADFRRWNGVRFNPGPKQNPGGEITPT